MPRSLWEPDLVAATRERIARLTPETPPRWGTMTAQRMIVHLGDAFRLTLGDTRAPKVPGITHTRFMKWLVVEVLPMPRGLTAPAVMMLSSVTGWHDDLETLNILLQRCVSRPANEPWGHSPYFGALTRDEWGKLSAKHVDHHLRQFGV